MNPEIDKIASAAIDGEATAEELARYEGDPGFSAAKSQLEVASEFVSQSEVPKAPAGLAQAQIALAMDQFRADAAQRAVLAAQPSVPPQTGAAKASKWGFPRWFVPAFCSIAVLAGLGIAAQNFSGGGDSESAADQATATTEAMESMIAADSGSDGDAVDDRLEEGAESGAAMPESTEAMSDDDSADEAMEDDAMEDEAELGFELPDLIDLDGAPFVTNETLTPSRVAELATKQPPIEPETYDRCGPEHNFDAPDGELVLVIPFTRSGEPAEVLIYDTGADGGRTALIVNERCEVLSQS